MKRSYYCGKGERIKDIDYVNTTHKMLQSGIVPRAHVHLLHPV